MRIFYTLLVILLTVLFSHISPQHLFAESRSKASAPSVQAQLKEADESFYFDGKAIHPGCVRRFNVGLADSPPPVVRSVDVAACVSSNENYEPFKTSDDGYVSYEYDLDEGEKGYFAYRYLGKTGSGLHVLDTRSNEGGTMVAMTVFLIDFNTGNYLTFSEEAKGKKDERLIMSCTGQITRGDRDTGTVMLEGNELTLGASQYRDKNKIITLD
ncbi:MAG: hypothetical protein RIG61_04970 [Deltaproteobacteria bacterium]